MSETPTLQMIDPAEAAARPGDWVRMQWLARLDRVVRPVLQALAAGRLMQTIDRGDPPRAPQRDAYLVLEAIGRSLCGIAPWLAGDGGSAAEVRLRRELQVLAVDAVRTSLDPDSPDAANFTDGQQPIVDAAFLAQAILRAPQALWDPLDDTSRQRLLTGLLATRDRKPARNNWLLFAAMIEAALHRFSPGDFSPMRVDYALVQHEAWYAGDGLYGDGDRFHADYYNSFVILPMLVEIAEACGPLDERWGAIALRAGGHLRRAAVILERLVAPDGTFPPIGRSLCYRCAAFQALALAALRGQLADELPPGQARAALTAVIFRTLDSPGTFNDAGWLQPGLAGLQPGLAERYISTGSLYLCTASLLPLGLPADAPFWTVPAEPWTQQRVWSGTDVPADHALRT
jgi:hypothetical protein